MPRGMTRMCGGNGIWVGVGAGGKIWASNDASHFTPIVSPTTKNLYAIAHGKTFFLAGGEGGEMVMGDGTTFLSSAKPFTGNEDIMGLSYIDSLGCFIVTNRIGEIAVSFDLASGWSKITSTSNVAIRAITNGLDAIVLGNDLGEIAASRKVMNLPWLNGNNGGNAKLVRIIGYDSDGMGIGQLVDQQGDATGDVLRDIIVLQPGI